MGGGHIFKGWPTFKRLMVCVCVLIALEFMPIYGRAQKCPLPVFSLVSLHQRDSQVLHTYANSQGSYCQCGYIHCKKTLVVLTTGQLLCLQETVVKRSLFWY